MVGVGRGRSSPNGMRIPCARAGAGRGGLSSVCLCSVNKLLVFKTKLPICAPGGLTLIRRLDINLHQFVVVEVSLSSSAARGFDSNSPIAHRLTSVYAHGSFFG